MKRSTVSGTGSAPGEKSSLRFKLFVAMLCVALVCIIASAVLGGLLARHQLHRFIERHEGPPPPPGFEAREWKRGPELMSLSFFLAGLLGLLLALGLSFLIAGRVSKPLAELTDATRNIAAGRYGSRVEVRGGKEVEELAEAFNYLSDSLQRNETLRKNMVADIAHELRTPLATMRAQLEALEDGIIEPDKKAIESLMEDILMLTRLVEDLHQLSLAEAGQLRLDTTSVGPDEIVKAAAKRFEHETGNKGLSLGIEIAPGTPPVDADQMRIVQVLGNLLQNSIRHTPGGGRITVGAHGSGEEATFFVEDTGPGINGEEVRQIFERLYRTDRSRARATGGAGLGLSIAKSIVEAHGGRIWAESAEGEGTTIKFTLPISRS